ncbi:Hypothetical protein NTJ_00481 [Nesidiocoris tenuis]|uniref:Uncharacterized protein n=1 Tax=Nesidiocoris tenuis TaxID=355587 RepID=A0ABN7A9W7_9HEMI|nr:Hypothetical protein NTJ_00481 [Nesidiocoris tenuis]
MGNRQPARAPSSYPDGREYKSEYKLISSTSPADETSRKSSKSENAQSSLAPSTLDDTEREPAVPTSVYAARMTTVVRNLSISLLIFIFLTIVMHVYMPRNLCPALYYVFLGYWLWLSVLIIGGQLVHLYFL